MSALAQTAAPYGIGPAAVSAHVGKVDIGLKTDNPPVTLDVVAAIQAPNERRATVARAKLTDRGLIGAKLSNSGAGADIGACERATDAAVRLGRSGLLHAIGLGIA